MADQKQSQLSSFNIPTTATFQAHKDYLFDVLNDLDGVQQNPYYHPEIDALYHSLQVFQIARNETDNPLLLSAALFHDIGKACLSGNNSGKSSDNHAIIGAQMLEGILDESILWLIEHHLDLLSQPKRTRKNLQHSPQLRQLERLRRWDLQGRKTTIEVLEPGLAIKIITRTDEIFQLDR